MRALRNLGSLSGTSSSAVVRFALTRAPLCFLSAEFEGYSSDELVRAIVSGNQARALLIKPS